MAKPIKSVRHIARLFPPGDTVKKKEKSSEPRGSGYKQSVYNTAKVYIRAVYIFWKKSFTEVLNFSKLSISNNSKGKSFQSFGARQANVFSPNLLLAEES